MKAIIMSVQPQWLQKILIGKKKIEMRKSIPKCNLPIDVYLYCTKHPRFNRFISSGKRGYVIDDFGLGGYGMLNGKVVAKFTLNKYTDMMKWAYSYKDNEFYELLKKTCIDTYELTNYAGNKAKRLYAWHIKRLEIFDTPKELSEFERRYAPQSWCYVEVKEVIEDE